MFKKTKGYSKGGKKGGMKPKGMQKGGMTKGYKKGGMDDGPGDITPAFLEPGEFVMTRPATQVLGARNLYKLMKQAEQMA